MTPRRRSPLGPDIRLRDGVLFFTLLALCLFGEGWVCWVMEVVG